MVTALMLNRTEARQAREMIGAHRIARGLMEQMSIAVNSGNVSSCRKDFISLADGILPLFQLAQLLKYMIKPPLEL
jgi:hypothetical protein